MGLLIDWLYQREFLTSGNINNGKMCNEWRERDVNFSLSPINVLADFSEGAGSQIQDNNVFNKKVDGGAAQREVVTGTIGNSYIWICSSVWPWSYKISIQ